MNLNLAKRLIIGSFIGGLVGYLILNPGFILLDDYLLYNNNTGLETILSSFTALHIKTAIFFIIIGIVAGLLQGLYGYKMNLLLEKTKLLSNTDALTSLYNRRYLMDELDKEIERSKRYTKSLTLMIADIDDFRDSNNTYGHIYGDRILQLLAKLLIGSTRKVDIVTRYGGDEFIIIMPETGKSMANILALRLLKKLNKYPYKNKKFPIKTKIRISIGIASFPDDAKNIIDLIHNADLALYKAKEKGGNRIVNFGLGPE